MTEVLTCSSARLIYDFHNTKRMVVLKWYYYYTTIKISKSQYQNSTKLRLDFLCKLKYHDSTEVIQCHKSILILESQKS